MSVKRAADTKVTTQGLYQLISFLTLVPLWTESLVFLFTHPGPALLKFVLKGDLHQTHRQQTKRTVL